MTPDVTLINCMSRFPRGAPFINHGSPNREPAELFHEFLRTHTSWVEFHLANGEVLAGSADHLPELQAEAVLRGVDGYLIGLTADHHRACAALPTRNVYPQLRADTKGPLLVANYQRRFLEPIPFAQCVRNGLTFTLDAADFIHRLPEIYAILRTLPAGPLAEALQSFGQRAELYRLDYQLSNGSPEGHLYEDGKDPQVLGEESIGKITPLIPPVIARGDDPRAMDAPVHGDEHLAGILPLVPPVVAGEDEPKGPVAPRPVESAGQLGFSFLD